MFSGEINEAVIEVLQCTVKQSEDGPWLSINLTRFDKKIELEITGLEKKRKQVALMQIKNGVFERFVGWFNEVPEKNDSSISTWKSLKVSLSSRKGTYMTLSGRIYYSLQKNIKKQDQSGFCFACDCFEVPDE